ncbi:hypothetical protein BC835DRAFT_1309341 [Cytidiella melzeri]|nr:hypothetical protein BC835DRAFT_1309341 [Cytidiella melzeri]
MALEGTSTSAYTGAAQLILNKAPLLTPLPFSLLKHAMTAGPLPLPRRARLGTALTTRPSLLNWTQVKAAHLLCCYWAIAAVPHPLWAFCMNHTVEECEKIYCASS